ncbi:MAG: tetratricopeptide repeat protein [Candidatus Omnitrophica bacterium]|nr:tetratricopeptide repeat protein [Candidatus Omnitrophota bacterium]
MFIVLLEVSLHLLGFIHLSLQEWRNRLALKQDSAFRILCLGESTTFGYEESYPSQLEEILNQRKPEVRFRVINLGRPGVDSNFILQHLEENLSKYNPHIVTVMMGINDRDISLLSKDHLFSKIKFFLRNFRVYKLTRLLYLHIRAKIKETIIFYRTLVFKNKTKNLYKDTLKGNLEYDWTYVKLGWHYKNEGRFQKAEEMFKKAIVLDPLNTWAYRELIQIYTQNNRHAEVEELFKRLLELNHFDYHTYMGWGWCLFDEKKYDRAEEYFKKAIQINPDSPEAYLWLGQTYIQQQKFNEAEDCFKKVILLEPVNERAYSALIFLSNLLENPEDAQRYLFLKELFKVKYYNAITQSNFRKLHDILKRRKIKLVCVQYPMRSVQPLKDIFKDREGIVFVDNEYIFKEAVKKEGYNVYFTDMFAGDFGHCTLKGNRLLAENIANVVLKEYFSPEIQGDTK